MVVKKSSMLLLAFGLALLHEGCSREDVGKQVIEAGNQSLQRDCQ